MTKDRRINQHGITYESIRDMARTSNAQRYRITGNDALEFYYKGKGWQFIAWCSDIRAIVNGVWH